MDGTIQLTTSGVVNYDATRRVIILDHSQPYPLTKGQPVYIADGQHRIEALKICSGLSPIVLSESVEVSIKQNQSPAAMYLDFIVANFLQKPPRKALEQKLIEMLERMTGFEDIPALPAEIARKVDEGRLGKSVRIVERLAKDSQSPFYGNIILFGSKETVRRPKLKQETLVDALNLEVFRAYRPLNDNDVDFDTCYRMLRNFFLAVDRAMVKNGNRSKSRLYTGMGVMLACKMSHYIFEEALEKTKFTEDFFLAEIKKGLLGMEDTYPGISTPDWWEYYRHGGDLVGIRGGNLGGVTELYNEFRKSLNEARRKGI